MNLRENNHELKKIYNEARPVSEEELSGEYLVDMLTVWLSFRRFQHRKVFYAAGEKTAGHNILFNLMWGRFYVVNSVIDYNRADNSVLIRRVRDQLRCVRKDVLYIGRFNYMLCGRLIFLGYFSLEKINK